VTLKSRLKITQGHWKRNHRINHTQLTISRLFDVEYYRDLEMWVRGHWRSLKMVRFESIGTVSYSLCTVYYGRTISHFGDSQRRRMTWPWNLGLGSFKFIENDAVRWNVYDFLLVRHCKYRSIFIIFELLTSNNIVTSKSGLEVTQDHWNWCHSIACVRFLNWLRISYAVSITTAATVRSVTHKNRTAEYDILI